MFFVETNEKDFGDTIVPNIFIDIFMPMADGLAVKVYLLGYRTACDLNQNPKFNNLYISENLNVPLSDVVNSWKFWESKEIIKIHMEKPDDPFDFSVEFVNLESFYIKNILGNDTSSTPSVQSIVDKNETLEYRKMFNEINKIIGRYLEPPEKYAIFEMMEKYNMSCDMIICAYQHSKDQTGAVKPVKYVERIIRNWYDANLYTVNDVEESFAVRSERYSIYRIIFKELGFRREPSRAEKETIDRWFDSYDMDIELVLEACSKSKNVPNPSVAYINGIIKKWKENEIRTLSELKKIEEVEKESKRKEKEEKLKNASSNQYNNYNKSSSSKPKKNAFRNFGETFTKYSPDELNDLISKSQKEKFK